MALLILTNQFNLKMSNIKNLKKNYNEFINLDDSNFLGQLKQKIWLIFMLLSQRMKNVCKILRMT